MHSITATAKTRIWGTHDAWSLAPYRNADEPNFECDVNLEIQGSERDGYHLVISPAGFFTADDWYESKQQALDAAAEMFGVSPKDWS